MKRNIIAFLTLAMVAVPFGTALAQAGAGNEAARPAPRPVAPVTIKQLRDNVYAALGGAGGVSGVVIGDKGVIVIDAKQTQDSAAQTIARIGEITPKPVSTIILTGNGGEGIPGLAAYPARLKIIAGTQTEKALKRLAAENARNKAPADRMPNILIKEDRKLLTLEGVRMVFLHIAPSHTVAESSIYLPDQRIVFTGYVAQGRPDFPIIHPDQDGSAEGWLKFMKALINLDADIYVLGPGDIWTKGQMEQRLAAQQTVYAQIKSLVAAGRSRDEIRAELHSGLNGRYPNYLFSEVAYDEIIKARSSAKPQ